jgi:hypothetical protein
MLGKILSLNKKNLKENNCKSLKDQTNHLKEWKKLWKIDNKYNKII